MVFNNSVLINFGTYTRTNTKDANGIIFVFPCAFSNNCFVIGQAWRNNNSVTDRDVTTDKELLMKRFEQFLSNPESTGCFIVRWKENEDNYNREDLWEYVEQCR